MPLVKGEFQNCYLDQDFVAVMFCSSSLPGSSPLPESLAPRHATSLLQRRVHFPTLRC